MNLPLPGWHFQLFLPESPELLMNGRSKLLFKFFGILRTELRTEQLFPDPANQLFSAIPNRRDRAIKVSNDCFPNGRLQFLFRRSIHFFEYRECVNCFVLDFPDDIFCSHVYRFVMSLRSNTGNELFFIFQQIGISFDLRLLLSQKLIILRLLCKLAAKNLLSR